VRLTLARDSSGYALTVEDDGEGIPATERESVFKPFTRLDTSRNRATGGHGLGLAIVARIAALHGGTVAVDESQALGGARFTLRWRAED
jgi:two-component system sensor histidine kinase RstB